MIKNALVMDLPVIEVPPELRGLSDEEIIAASESRKKKSENPYRPSKKERETEKLQQIQQKMQTFVTKIDSGRPELPGQASLEVKPSESFRDLFARSFESVGGAFERAKSVEVVVRSSISSTPKPASGRVLTGKFAFGKKNASSTATVVNAADLERERAEERAKKILLQQKAKVAKIPIAVEYDCEGNPIKRKRGRPRKNPLE